MTGDPVSDTAGSSGSNLPALLCPDKGHSMTSSRMSFRALANRTVTCQWHFLQCVHAKAMEVKERHRKTFRKLCRRWTAAATRSEYDSISAALRTLCEKSGILSWFLWWEECGFHIVPAFRGFNLSGLNLAESGQSGMKPKTRKKLRLIDAAYKDCSQMMRQDEMYKAYIGNISKEIGKGLNIRQIQERDRRAQEERAKKYADVLLRGDVNAETDNEENSGQANIFIPTDAARHRAPRVHSKRNPTEKKRREEDCKKRNICLMPVLFTQMSLKRYPNLWMMTLLDL